MTLCMMVKMQNFVVFRVVHFAHAHDKCPRREINLNKPKQTHIQLNNMNNN